MRPARVCGPPGSAAGPGLRPARDLQSAPRKDWRRQPRPHARARRRGAGYSCAGRTGKAAAPGHENFKALCALVPGSESYPSLRSRPWRYPPAPHD